EMMGVLETWPVLVVHLTLLGCLIAATLIDAEHFIIPLEIPWLATAVALVLLPGAAALGWMVEPVVTPGAMVADVQPMVPTTGTGGLGAAVGGAMGLIVALLLLRRGVIPQSFSEPVDESKTVAE